jgi:hypothetical protein
MPLIKEQPREGPAAFSGWQTRKDESVHRETAQFLSRLDFRHISSHINQKRPGYYLILLRTELRHRTLRDKPALTD